MGGAAILKDLVSVQVQWEGLQVGRGSHVGGRSFMRWGGVHTLKGGVSGARGMGGPGAAPGHNGLSGRLSVISTPFAAPRAALLTEPLPHGAQASGHVLGEP